MIASHAAARLLPRGGWRLRVEPGLGVQRLVVVDRDALDRQRNAIGHAVGLERLPTGKPIEGVAGGVRRQEVVQRDECIDAVT